MEGEVMTEWNFDMDAAPRDGTKILGWWRADIFGVIYWDDDDWFESYQRVNSPKAWQPLPATPSPSSTRKA
jgi:hypothetical protein